MSKIHQSKAAREGGEVVDILETYGIAMSLMGVYFLFTVAKRMNNGADFVRSIKQTANCDCRV